MPTKVNPKDITAVDKAAYNNLKEEILDIKSKISSVDTATDKVAELDTKVGAMDTKVGELSTEVVGLKQDIKDVVINADTINEVAEARIGFETLDDRLDHIEGLDVFKKTLNLSSERVYEYNDAGYITKETVSGDMAYEVVYEYDAANNIKKETHTYNGNPVGVKEYIYDSEDNIVKIINTNTDIIELVTEKGIQAELGERIEVLEDIGIKSELDMIKSALFIDEYDGKDIVEHVNKMDTRVKVIEDLMPTKIYDILDLPGLRAKVKGIEDNYNILFQLASEGKTGVANAITSVGVPSESTEKFSSLASKISGQLTKKSYYDALIQSYNAGKIAIADALNSITIPGTPSDSFETLADNIKHKNATVRWQTVPMEFTWKYPDSVTDQRYILTSPTLTPSEFYLPPKNNVIIRVTVKREYMSGTTSVVSCHHYYYFFTPYQGTTYNATTNVWSTTRSWYYNSSASYSADYSYANGNYTHDASYITAPYGISINKKWINPTTDTLDWNFNIKIDSLRNNETNTVIVQWIDGGLFTEGSF